jgi:hypothetical protein
MKVIKNLIGMALLVGLINPFVFTNHQQWYQGFVCLLASFIGSGLIFGFDGYRVAPKKIGNAVARNRAKRRLREVARAVLPTGARAGWDYVLVAKPGVTTLRDYALLLADLRGALGRIHKP